MGIHALAIIWYADELISRANTTIAVLAWQINAPGHGRTVRAFAQTIRPFYVPSGFPCRAVQGRTRTTMWHPNSSKHNWIVWTYHWTA
jgi:hypothetical protein